MDSKVGLIIQFSGVFFVTALFFLLSNSLKSNVLSHWKKGWLWLSIALISLQIAFNLKSFNQPFYVIYYFGEYVFSYYLISGCYSFATNNPFPSSNRFFLVAGFLVAVFLTFFNLDFNSFFNFHAFIIGTIFVVAFFTLKKPINSIGQNQGWGLMRFSLALLAIDFYHYVILFSLQQFNFKPLIPPEYLAFNPVIDLMFEILLGFGMVIVLMEKVRNEVEDANRKLQETHEKLEQLVKTDPLTTAFSRHAFYGFLKKNGDEHTKISGCVGFFDIDDLKPINDIFGHHIGDIAIRTVTSAIRSLMRAEDLIFRWGGDEFFVIMVSMNEQMARERMSRLTKILTNISIEEISEKLTINVSFGFCNFSDVDELEEAIKSADEEMYRNKQENKIRKRGTKNLIPVFESNRFSV